MSVNAWAAKVSFGADVNSKNKQSVLLALEGTVADASYAPFLREVWPEEVFTALRISLRYVKARLKEAEFERKQLGLRSRYRRRLDTNPNCDCLEVLLTHACEDWQSLKWMEVHVEAANAEQLPKGCYVSVRVGDVLKQGRYEPQRAYNFPGIDRRRDVRIDVYQHVGNCLLTAEPDSSAMHDTYATSTNPDFPAMKFKVSVSTKSEEVQKSKTDRAAKMKGKAKEYLGKHRIEELLSEAVKALLKEQPTEPVDFICKYLSCSKKEPKLMPVTGAKPGSKPMKLKQDPSGEESFVDLEGGGTADPRNDLPDVRSEMRQLLVEAAGNGQLREALKDFDDESGRKAEAVREKAGDLLMAATENGDFEKILKDLQSSDAAKKKNVDEIRTKAAQLLVSSADNGDLRKALAEIRTMPAQPSPRQETRRKAAELLVEAADNGQLKKALEEIKGSPSGPNLQKLQMKVGDVLMAAIENGDLEKAIKEVSENPPADPAAGAS
ncbi:unnamed protein product [Durusdinium trenchii]|uniref:Uncharacterized protein n=1 Tax=Durusdinium trenchii TaxID=1381693 RepID=A0ABP0HZ63_9DINO